MRDLLLRMFVASLACLACAGACVAQTQAEMNAEACGAYRAADEELNRVYARILRDYRSDVKFVRKLRAAQRAWLVYRDAHLAARFPEEDKRGNYGSVFPMCFCMVQEEVTRARTEVLKKWVDGLDMGDVCAGSVRIREEGETSSSRRVRRTRVHRRANRVGGRRHATGS
ncbi:MAG TPA: lysozyme inhibitor LprI family protein [Pyrinomonadaceae bacterium]|nr:lysozyme inhibitor LprI family protein [Pyrinomonadaceae bacterium]